jgi:hypothetical protein
MDEVENEVLRRQRARWKALSLSDRLRVIGEVTDTLKEMARAGEFANGRKSLAVVRWNLVDQKLTEAEAKAAPR